MDNTIPVSVELAPSLGAFAAAGRTGSLAQRVETGLAVVLAELGLAGQPKVEVQIADCEGIMRICVCHINRPYSSRLLQQVWVAVAPAADRSRPIAGEHGGLGETHQYRLSDDWFADYVEGIAATEAQADWQLAIEFLARSVCEVVREDPACMLGSAQIDACAGSAQEWSDPAAVEELGIVLELLLSLGISLAEREPLLPIDADISKPVPVRRVLRVRETLLKEFQVRGRQKRRAMDVAEAVFAHLRAPRIEIHVHPAYLETLFSRTAFDLPTVAYAKEADAGFHELFRLMEDGLFYDLGIGLPSLVWVPSRTVPEGMIAIKINDRLGLPIPGLRPGEIFVNETVERLLLLQQIGQPALSPINGSQCAVLPEAAKEVVEQAGLTTWNAAGYLILVLAAEIRRYAQRLVSSADAEYLLAQLENAFPELVQASAARYSPQVLAPVLRGLLEEGLSIRNLRAILELLLEFDTVSVDTAEYIVLDPRLAMPKEALVGGGKNYRNYLEHVRSGLKYYITNKYYNYSAGYDSLLVYLLDSTVEAQITRWEIERRCGPRGAISAEQLRDAIRAAIRAEARSVAGDTRPIIVTTNAARRATWELIADELPDLPVVAYSELQPDINITPVARISLP
jgi:hypothetical protein